MAIEAGNMEPLCPMECVRGDPIAHCHGQANETQFEQKSQSIS